MSAAVDKPIEPGLGRNLSFHFLWSSTFASGFADRLAMLAVAVMLGQGVKDEAVELIRLGDAAIVAATQFWFFLPYMIWGPFAGWLADVLPRKWLMFVADEARGLIILCAYLLLPHGQQGMVIELYDPWFTVDLFGTELVIKQSWKIWAIMFSVGFFAATFSPARNSVIPNVVGGHVLQRANSIVLGLGVIGNLVGFLAGGELAGKALRACILTSSMCYLLSGLMWPFLSTPVRRRRGDGAPKRKHLGDALGEIIEGGRHVVNHKPLLALTLVNVLFWSGSAVVLAAGSAIAVDLYGGKIEDFARIGGAFGVGMLGGAVLLSFVNSRLGGELLVIIGMLGAAVFLSLLVVVPSMTLGIAIALACGLFGGILMITITTMLQQFTADLYRGRVMGFKDLVSDIGNVGVNLLIWVMPRADHYIGYVAHVFALALVLTAAYGLRRYVYRGPMPTGLQNMAWRVVRLYVSAMHRARLEGAHRVPRSGPVIIVANHTAGLDPLLIQAATPRLIRWMMDQEFMIRPLGFMWRSIRPIPVDRSGGHNRQALRGAIEALRAGEAVGIFPEGGINRDAGSLREFEAGIGLLVRKSGALVVPAFVSGTPSGGAWRPLWKISRSRVAFGPPVTAPELEQEAAAEAEAAEGDSNDRHAAIARALRRRVEALRPGNDASAPTKAAEGDSAQPAT